MDITVEELKQRMDKKEEILVIDVREPHEYDEFNIGAKNIPLANIPLVLMDMEDNKEQEIIVHCRSGKRSATAQAIFGQAGFKNVRNLIGGILKWQEKFGQKKIIL